MRQSTLDRPLSSAPSSSPSLWRGPWPPPSPELDFERSRWTVRVENGQVNVNFTLTLSEVPGYPVTIVGDLPARPRSSSYEGAAGRGRLPLQRPADRRFWPRRPDGGSQDAGHRPHREGKRFLYGLPEVAGADIGRCPDARPRHSCFLPDRRPRRGLAGAARPRTRLGSARDLHRAAARPLLPVRLLLKSALSGARGEHHGLRGTLRCRLRSAR